MRKVISVHTKTCGGTIHKLDQGREHYKWLHDHWDVVLKVAENNKEWYKANTDKVKANHSILWNENRGKVDLSHQTSKIKECKRHISLFYLYYTKITMKSFYQVI